MLLGLAVLLLAACNPTEQSETEQSPATDEDYTGGELVALDEESFDWGDIDIEAGDVMTGFHFKNEGEENLMIYGAETSCMCTTAYLELPDGSKSPTFGMHGNPEWSYELSPGEEFEVEVIYDPMAHGPNGVGPVKRLVRLDTSDGIAEMDVSANVLYSEEYKEKYSDQPFVFEEIEFDFGIVKQSSGINSHDFEFTYMGEETIEITGVPASCACTSGKVSANSFSKGDSGVLTVEFDPNLHEEPEGKFFKTVSLLTNPELEKQPEVKIWVEMDLDLGPGAYKLKQHID